MHQQTLPDVNLATHLLHNEGADITLYDGYCADVADMVIKTYGGQLVYVDGDALDQYGWWYHAVPYVNGMIHDAWLHGWHCVAEPQTLPDWLVKMFGTEQEISVTIDGNDIYKGLPQNFSPRKAGLKHTK